MDKVKNHYKHLSIAFGKEIKPVEEFVNNLGYRFMGMQQFKRAEDLWKLNVTNYSDSFNACDSLGDLYVAIENKERVIDSFKKLISLDTSLTIYITHN